MVRAKVLACVYAVATVAVLVPGSASAQPADKRTFFTFSGAVDMPGVALPAGRYEFRIANTDSSRNVIQVRSTDGKRSYGLFMTRTAERAAAPTDAEVRFMEAGSGEPPAVRTWWYPGERIGYEFVYPKAQARRIAQRSRQSVLTTRLETTTTPEAGQSDDLVRISPTGSEGQIDSSADAVPSGAAQVGERADSTPAHEGTVARARTQLPQTGSWTPLMALIGVLMIAAAGVLGLLRARIV
jgi:LPXTG-motif cell wall-anchored protein